MGMYLLQSIGLIPYDEIKTGEDIFRLPLQKEE